MDIKSENIQNLHYYANPLCKVIIGFRNHTKHLTRSKYISFNIQNEPEMSRLLLLLAHKKLNEKTLKNFSPRVIAQLCEYKLFEPLAQFTVTKKIKKSLFLLNENRNTVIYYQGVAYAVTSFIFMAFYSQKINEYLQETVILPFWYKKFSQHVFDILSKKQPLVLQDQLPKKIFKRFVKHGVLSPTSELPSIENFFSQECVLSERLFAELPVFAQQLLPQYSPQDKILLNQKIYFDYPEMIPIENEKKLQDYQWVLRCQPSIWVEDPITQTIFMYWLTQNQLTAVHQLMNHEIQPESLDTGTFKLFCYINIIYSADGLAIRKQQWKDKLNDAKNQLQENGLITFHDLLPPPELAISRAYIRYLNHKKYLLRDKANGATKERYWIHLDEFTTYIHHQICKILNQFLPSPVKAGHNGITIYQIGAVLPKHTDDVLAFNWVMSLPVETSPVRNREDAWPIYIETPSSKILPAKLRMGDGHIIDPQMPHWRETLTDHTLGILLLWFVPENFKGYVNGNWLD